LHAIMDAILGASGLGDIGEHFPNTSRKYKGASSLVLLKQVGVMSAKAGFTIVNNIDAVLIAEEPKITPYKKEMRSRIAKALGMDVFRVNIKATTNEGLGSIGAKQGMAAYATVSIRKG
jgi:2-C-methyl-D-erythritol 2,4-cyclodiphosphate synthase